jgi:hypothetical protein
MKEGRHCVRIRQMTNRDICCGVPASSRTAMLGTLKSPPYREWLRARERRQHYIKARILNVARK